MFDGMPAELPASVTSYCMLDCSYRFIAVKSVVCCTGVASDSGSQTVFGGSVASADFGQLAWKKVGQPPAVFGSISAIAAQPPSSSSAAVGLTDSGSVFGSGTKVVGFSDLAAPGSGVGDFTKKSGLFLTRTIFLIC